MNVAKSNEYQSPKNRLLGAHMRLRELQTMSVACWPPTWVGQYYGKNIEGKLTNVQKVPGTSILKVDVEHKLRNRVGIIIVEKELLAPIYLKIKENIGRTLDELGDIEI